MSERIDMSLDDIIKRDRITTGRGRKRGGAKNATRNGLGNRGAVSGGRKSVGIRKIGATSRQMKAGNNRRKKNVPRVLPDKWTHDKFVADVKSATLMISNLDFGVSDQDIRELFSEFGPLKKAAVHYDSSGRSLGKAEVIFFKINDSIRAMKKYNGVPLDGRPMQIQPVVTTTASNIASRIGNPDSFKKNINAAGGGNKPRGIGRGGPVRNAGRRGRGGRIGQRAGTQRGQKKVPTADELDADLDAYANKI